VNTYFYLLLAISTHAPAQVDRFDEMLLGDARNLSNPVAAAHNQGATKRAKGRIEVGEGVDEKSEPVRAPGTRAQDRLVDDEERHDRVRPARRHERRLVANPEISGENHDGGAH